MAAAAVLASTASVHASSATVKSECDFDVYLQSVGDQQGDVIMIQPYYTEGYRERLVGGTAMMVATELDESNLPKSPSQLEYTYNSTSSEVWYDITNIVGQPFMEYGVTLTPSASDLGPQWPTCVPVVCAAGDGYCTAAYNLPDDNTATHVCPSDVDLVMTLCTGQSTAKRETRVERREESRKRQRHRHRHTHAH